MQTLLVRYEADGRTQNLLIPPICGPAQLVTVYLASIKTSAREFGNEQYSLERIPQH
jgi:hypothetical protein